MVFVSGSARGNNSATARWHHGGRRGPVGSGPAIEANDAFIERLEAIRNRAQGLTLEHKD